MSVKKEYITDLINTGNYLVDRYNPKKRLLPFIEKLPDEIKESMENEYDDLVVEWDGKKKKLEEILKEFEGVDK